MASEKRRSVGAWVALGFLFGVFAVILLAFLPTLPKTLELPIKEG